MNHKFTQNIISIYGENGQKWLNQLPQIIIQLQKIWGVGEVYPVDNLSYNYVLQGKRAKQDVIIKISFRADALAREVEALRHYNGNGCVELLQYSEQYSAILLDKLTPGNMLLPLAEKDPQQALSIACNIAKKLHSSDAVNNKFQAITPIQQWTRILDESWPILSKNTLRKACLLRDELLAKKHKNVILHGDLHNENILQSNDQWISIDPKGVIGDPAIDLWCLVRDHDLIDQAAQIMNMDAKHIAQWGYVMAVVSCCWRIEDNLDVAPFMKYVKHFDKYL